MTTRLYYTDSFLTRFDAIVREAGILPDGRSFVVLDQTAFYPTSGGQPHDVGQLGGARVVDVIDRDEDSTVVHVVDHPLLAGAAVAGEIDLSRRVDHIQQHSGQHVLSAAFVHVCSAPTVSFHLGADTSTIDISATLDAAQIARGEDEANRVVLENRSVAVRYASAEEAGRLPLRKESKREGTLRLVDIENWDLSACGGTHVARTGSIGGIMVTGWERYKGGTRVGFVCGLRAVRYQRHLRDALTEATRTLSVQAGELPEAVARLQAESREARQHARTLTESLAKYEAQELAGRAQSLNGRRVVVRVIDRDANGLKLLAQAVCALGPDVVLVSSTRPALVVAARGAEAAEPFDAKSLVASLIARFGGKGGGRPELAQAGGLDATPEDIANAARSIAAPGSEPTVA